MNSNNLTVVVKDINNKVAKDAKVSLLSGGTTSQTDKDGQAIIALPNQNKVIVRVSLNGTTQEVPYYISDNQNHRLEINFAYLNQVLLTPTPTPVLRENDHLIFPITITLIIVVIGIYLLKKLL